MARRPLDEETLKSIEQQTGLPIPSCLRECFELIGLFQDLTPCSASEYEAYSRPEEFPMMRKFLVEHFGKPGAELFPFADDGARNVVAVEPGKDGDRMYFADHEALKLKELSPFSDWLSSVVDAALRDKRADNTLKHWCVQFCFRVATPELVLTILRQFGTVELGAWIEKKKLPSGVETSEAPLQFAGKSFALNRSEFWTWERPSFALNYDEPVNIPPDESVIAKLKAAFPKADVGYKLVDYGPLRRDAKEEAEPVNESNPGKLAKKRLARRSSRDGGRSSPD